MMANFSSEEKVPVILVSAGGDLAQIARRVGTPYFLGKTGDIDSLLAMLDRALRERIAPSSA
jgi:hypothetical protein